MTKLDALLDRLTDLAASAPEPSAFFRAILDAVHTFAQPDAAALWSVVGTSYRLELADGLVELGIERDAALQELHESALAEVCHSTDVDGHDSGASVPRSATSSAPSAMADWTERRAGGRIYRFFACRARGRAFLAIELVFADSASDRSEAQQRLLSAIAEIAHDYHNAKLLESYQQREHLFAQLETLIVRIHSHSSLEATAYEIVNETRRFLNCDRVILVSYGRGRTRALAVSAVSELEPRARQLRTLESLVTSVVRSVPHWHFPSQREEPPERLELLQAYLDESRSERLTIDTLYDSMQAIDNADNGPDEESRIDRQLGSAKTPLGGLVIEQFRSATDTSLLDQRLRMVLPHVQLAFRNAVAIDALPLLKVNRGLQRWSSICRRRGLAWIVLACLLAGLVTLATLIPAELNISAKGVFEPHGWQHIYAPLNGEIVEVIAEHQQMVSAGQPLLIMRSRELELKKEELTTQRSVSMEKLRGIEAARLGSRKPTFGESSKPFELSANQREIEEVVTSLDRQLVIVEQMLASLQINSPIAGQVVSWNTAATLERRPVQQGQRLVSLAAPDGTGRLQLRVLDSDIRHVIDARAKSASSGDQPDLLATFSIATNPGRQFTARVLQVGTIVETVSIDGASVRVEASVESNQLTDTRPGATVLATIHCGRSNLAYVWTRRIWDYLRLHGFFSYA